MFNPFSFLKQSSQCLHLKTCLGMLEVGVTEPGIVEFTGETEAVIFELVLTTEAVVKDKEFDAGEAVPARAAWRRAARWLFLSLCAGPRCRGRQGGD